MKKVTAKFSAESAYGKEIKDYGKTDANGKLVTKVEGVTGEFTEYENLNEVSADDKLTDKQLLAAVNAKIKAAAKAAATTAALDALDIKKPSKDDPEYIREENIKSIMARNNCSREMAEKVQKMNDELFAQMRESGQLPAAV